MAPNHNNKPVASTSNPGAPDERIAYLVAIIAGGVLWVGTAAISGAAEAWDASLYWSVAYPIAIGVAGGLGFMFPDRAWRWGLAVILVQLAVMVVTAPGSASMLPLGLLLFMFLSLPAMAAALLLAMLRRRFGRA